MEKYSVYEKNVYCIAILVLVSFFVWWSINKSVQKITSEHTSVLARAQSIMCTKKVEDYDAAHDKKVILRLDDVQAFMWSDVSRAVMQSAIDRGAPIVAGVIPKDISKDRKMIEFLRKERCNIEIALHGWDHGRESYAKGESENFYEFEDSTYEEAYAAISNGRREVRSLANQEIITFIPPNNHYSLGTLHALRTLGFHVNSAGEERLFDYSAPTYDSTTQSIVPIDHIVDTCEKKFSQGTFCVIMIHPREYALPDGSLNDEVFADHFLQLLDQLRAMDVHFVLFKNLVDDGYHDERFID